ncbi:MAG: discoidin domain-containing protein [Ignavibacteriales bacterium]|nr:MAG: discoidin domain-containing protein [Ignavibacteriales bacterium]
MKNPVGLFKPAKYLIEPSWKYPANGIKTLTDGLRGDEDYRFNWLGFEGEDMEVVLDLGEIKTIKKVSADFLQVILSWVFLPQQIEVSISDDGNNFKNVSIVKNTESLEKDGAFIQTFSAEFAPVQTRYIKVKADNIEICPDWHIGHPLEAWIFTDEIVVE